ncbi:unnamed protein product [Nezara viridula]|uniref:E3 ubiquitin-protein ligase listerin n=1 Tax=Nezara viridula TaxID=85310 RepID=A0A9P0HU82_NEZVI|nr:unnamed protein product [Nezara viridula]
MGGHKRKGQSQRTKNNMKPSNSGRIAELVDNKGFQFSSFSTLSEPHLASSSTQMPSMSLLSIEMFCPNVDPNFQVVFKKINKKDATTRFKALQELKDLCKASTPEVIKEVLPVWARIYCILAIDVEHRVREAVQEVHRLIVNSVGRNLAPYLKQIAPLWFISQYDTYAPAASIASNAFQEVFSAQKMIEVISFCQGEILNYIKENVLNLTPQSLSKGDLNKDEMEAKYERIIVSSLNGYALYLSKIPEEQIENYKTINQEIVSSSKFWKFSKFKSAPIRSAWFTLLSSLCQNCVFLLENEKKQVANSIIGGIDDYDSAVLSIVWEAALHSFTHIKDFWLHVNIDKFFLPKFCNILQHGGQGNASCIYPNILLLLNSIPEDVINDKHQFFEKIFGSFQAGMKLQLVVQSPSESDAVASSFLECIQYLIKTNIEDKEFCLFLLEQHLLKALSTYMLETVYRYQLKAFVKSLSRMIIYWHKNEDSLEFYGILIQKFWTDLLSLSVTSFKNCSYKEQLSVILQSHFMVISILNTPHAPLKKKLRVSFVEDSKVDGNVIESKNLKDTNFIKNNTEKKLEDNMLVFAKELFKEYYKFSLETENKEMQILMLSQMNKIIELLNAHLNSFILILEPKWSTSVFSWLRDSEISMENLLGIIFCSLEYLDTNDQTQLMTELTQERCKECLKDALRVAYNTENVKLKQWLQSEDMKKEICQTYKEVCDEENKVISGIAKHFFDLNIDREFIVGVPTVISLLEIIKVQLSSNNESNLKIATEMADTLLNKIASVKKARYAAITLTMLEPIFVNIIEGHGNVVFKTWEKGMQYVVESEIDKTILNEHLLKLCDQLTTFITNRETKFDSKFIHYSVIHLLTILINNDETKNMGFTFINTLLSSIYSNLFKTLQRQIEEICLFGDAINGKLNHHLNIPENSNVSLVKEKWDPLRDINVLGYVRSLDFVLMIMLSAYGVEINEEEKVCDWEHKLVFLPNILNEVRNEFDLPIINLSCGLVLLKKFKIYYSSTRQYFDVKNYIEPFGRLMKELIQSCDPNQQKRILNKFASVNLPASNILCSEAKEVILEFLEGTLQDETSKALANIHIDEKVSEFILDINEVRKLRKQLENLSLSHNEMNTTLKIVAEKFRESFIFPKSLEEIPENLFGIAAEVAWLFQTAIARHPTILNTVAWDFARVSVTRWLECISFIKDMPDDCFELIAMSSATCRLLITISDTLSVEESLASYCEEWKEVFAADAYYFLCKSWKNITETALSRGVNYMTFLHIVQLSETISYLCDMKTFHKLKPENGSIKEWVEFTMTCILAPSVPVQLTSYKILEVLLPNLTKLDEGLNESSLDKISCNMFEPKLMETQTVFMTMLQDFSIGVSCSVAPFTDSYTYSLAYLLLWSVLIKICQEGDLQQKYIYPLWIKEKDIIHKFIEGVAKVMPESVIYFLEKNVKKGQEFFVNKPSHSFSDWTSEKLSHLGCWLLSELMATLPAVVRQWASEAEPKQLAFIDRLVTAFISPNLAAREMLAISKQQKSFDNMKVYTHPSVREVVAVYTVEESSTELVVQLAFDHPLSPPKVDISKAMISSIQTRQWLKQLTIFLTHQNGSIWEGLVLWKNNLDKKFEGIEECYICFSILNNTTHQLPKLSCHTCKKKFHSYCLYKWFSTSHKSTCPICRAIF